jgi:hypothetical protein
MEETENGCNLVKVAERPSICFLLLVIDLYYV